MVVDQKRKDNGTCIQCNKINKKCDKKIQLVISSFGTSKVNGAQSILNEENDFKTSCCSVCDKDLTHYVQTTYTALCDEHCVLISEDQITSNCVTCASLTAQMTRPNHNVMTTQDEDDREAWQNHLDNITAVAPQPTLLETQMIHPTSDSRLQAITENKISVDDVKLK
ncbi:hypothetical protein DPMN_056148 [Dreissena polymorpha]|uniref:Uncharacterized protein n=1 Tax=Dreissena polymorpha TaxID=45954 RepID=A0A9D4HR91_DREPO|nr:hypothetical protein DPMN_056148 [Dreissena polymorpha]